MRRKLHFKLILLIVIITLLPFLLVMSQAIVKLQDIQRKDALVLEEHVAKLAAREVAEFIGLQFGELDAVESLYPALFEYPDLQKESLEWMLFSHDSFTDIVLIDSNGKEIARVNRRITITPDDLIDRAQDREFRAVEENGRFIGDIFWERNRPFFVIGRGVYDFNKIFRGAVFAKIDARVMQEVIQKISVVEEKGRAYIVEKSGVVVAYPDISQVLIQKNFSSIPIVKAFVQQEGELPILLTDVYQNELNQEVLGVGLPISLFFEHHPRGALYTNWFVIAELPTTTTAPTMIRIFKVFEDVEDNVIK